MLNFNFKSEASYDAWLMAIVVFLAYLGLLMTTSVSISDVASANDIFYISKRHIMYLFICFFASIIVLAVPMHFWFKLCPFLLLFSIFALLAVLFFGISVNGSRRWLSLGFFQFQVAELAKLSFLLYLASYIHRRQSELIKHVKGFYKPVALLCLIAVLLLLQPDLGSIVVLFAITVALLFLAGSRIKDFLFLITVGVVTILILSLISPYRLKRIVSFLDPWSDPFGSGYQLVQSLIAYGRGGLFGVGLGNSVQKLDYLPEAHTDFILAILAEELGFLGLLFTLLLLLLLAFKTLFLGNRCLDNKKIFEGFVAYGIGMWIFMQTLINSGVSLGLIPTKGLTLPFISYGGSSLLFNFIAVMIVLRIDYELRLLYKTEAL